MEKQPRQNNGHYSEQSGHKARGAMNKAMRKAYENGFPLSKGEVSYTSRRFMMRDQGGAKRKR